MMLIDIEKRMHSKFSERDNNDLCVIVSQRDRLQVSSHVVLIRQRWRATRQ